MARPKEFKEIILDIEDGIATLTLHRPDNMNAFTGTMMYEMIEAFDIHRHRARRARFLRRRRPLGRRQDLRL